MKRIFLRVVSISIFGIFGLLWLPTDACGGGTVVAWGGNNVGQINPCAEDVVAIATGYEQSVLLKRDGTVANCGMHYEPSFDNWYYPIIVPAGLSNVIAVAGGYAHSLALKADGTVVAWGRNTSGQTNVPPDLTNVVAISAAIRHSLALKADGTVVAWGSSGASVPDGLTNVVAIAAGSANLALKADGTVVGWNLNSYSTDLIASLTNVVAISAGWNEWLALKADGTMAGQGGYVVPSDATNVVAIAASSGTDHHISLAVKADGTVIGWGFNFYGYYDGSPRVPVGLTNVVAVSGDSGHNLALVGGGPPFLMNRLVSRTALMSGSTFFRIEASGARPLSYEWQLNGTNLPGGTNAVLALNNLQSSQAGNYSVVVSNASGVITNDSVLLTLIPLGITAEPQSQTNFVGGVTTLSIEVLGIEPLHYQWQFNDEDLPEATNSTLVLSNLQIAQGGVYSVVVTNNYGRIVSSSASITVVPVLITAQPRSQVMYIGGTTGFSVEAQGIQPLSYQWRHEDVDLTGATNNSLSITNLSRNQAGRYSVTLSNTVGVVRSRDAFLSVSRVAAWGYSGYNQTNVPGESTNAIGIAAGHNHSLALKADGTVVAWGANYYGQTDVPPDLTNVVAVASGNYAPRSLALKDDGTVVAWGTSSSYPYPSPPAVLTNAVATAAGQGHVLALRADGTVLAWGSNGNGESTPPIGLADVVAISAGQAHSLALRSDGSVVAWGAGTPTADPSDWWSRGQSVVPADLTNAIAIAAGTKHSLALRADGSVAAWGDNYSGQTNVPSSLTDVVAIAAGEYYNLALTADGIVLGWGGGSNTNPPAALTNVVAIVAGGAHSMALISDGPPVLQALVTNPTWESNRFGVSVPTQSGKVYRLEYQNSLEETTWTALPLVAGNGGVRTLDDPTATGTQRFYRVRHW